MPTSEYSARLAEFVADEDELRACDALPDGACREVPGNVVWNVVSGALAKVGEQLSSPGTVLPWVLGAVGAPTAFVGLLVPVKDGGSLLPQLVVAGRLRAVPRRTPWWVASALVRAAAVAATALAIAAWSGATAGVAVLVALLVTSIASGVGSVAYKDVLAKTVPKGARGRVLAWRASVGGVLGVGAGLLLQANVADVDARGPFVVVLLAAAGALAASAGAFARVVEAAGATEGGRDALQEARAGWRFLREDRAFRRFLTARSLLFAVPLATPFLTVYGQRTVDSGLGGLGVFVVATALASSLASLAWGRAADDAAQQTMAWAGVVGVASVAYALAVGGLFPEVWRTAWVYAPAFLGAGVAHAGVRLGRKTWLVDAAPDEHRPTYVATANTVIGGVTVLGGALGAAAGALGPAVALVTFAGAMAVGAVVALRLPAPGDVGRP